MRSISEDLEMGFNNEQLALPRLERHLDTNLRVRGQYAVLDFSNQTENVFVELKSRRIPHNAYATTIITKNKVDVCADPNKRYYFAYLYTDGLYIIQYNKELFDTFERNEAYQRGFRTGATNNPQSIVYIPVNLLTKIAE
jgi:hypothetical protein